MSKDQDFTPLNLGKDKTEVKHRRYKSGVIKSGEKHVEGSVRIVPQIEETEAGVEFFQPIYEGDIIIGVLHKCSCGRTAEVRFQYEDQ